MVKTYNASDFKVGQTITVERHPVYASSNTPSYTTSSKTVERVRVFDDNTGNGRVYFKGVAGSFDFSASGQSFIGGVNRPLRYKIV